jgi:hypothetical protein
MLSISILFSHLHLVFPRCLFRSGFIKQNTIYKPSLACYMLWPSLISLCDHRNTPGLKHKSWSFSMCNFLQSPLPRFLLITFRMDFVTSISLNTSWNTSCWWENIWKNSYFKGKFVSHSVRKFWSFLYMLHAASLHKFKTFTKLQVLFRLTLSWERSTYGFQEVGCFSHR